MRTRIGILAVMGAVVLPLGASAPSASADGLCRPGYSLYDTGHPGAFKQDRNLNGLICDKTRETADGFRHQYTDDR